MALIMYVLLLIVILTLTEINVQFIPWRKLHLEDLDQDRRSQLLGAFFNGVLLLALRLITFLQAIERFNSLQCKYVLFELVKADLQ